MRYLQFIFGLIIILTSACTKENESYFPNEDKDFYPLVSGCYNTYDVTEIIIDAPSEVYDTSKYQLKELIGGTYITDEGKNAYLLMRYKRNTPNSDWNISDVWSVQFNSTKLYTTEENIRYVKMHLPLSIGKSWDGNAYNTNDQLMYKITDLDIPLTVNNQFFDSCLFITHELDSSLIHKDIDIEQFARDTGLIYKEITHINSQEIEPGVPLNERITTGTIYKQSFIERGKEENYNEN